MSKSEAISHEAERQTVVMMSSGDRSWSCSQTVNNWQARRTLWQHSDLTGIRGLDALISSLGRRLSGVVDIDFTVLTLCKTTNSVLRRISLFSDVIIRWQIWCIFWQWQRCSLSLFNVGPQRSFECSYRITKYGTRVKCSITVQIIWGCTTQNLFLKGDCYF